MKIGKCCLCGKTKNLIKAHLLPKFFYLYLYSGYDRNKSLILFDGENKTVKKRPVGTYDQNILCRDCDGKLGVYDNYAKYFWEKDLLSYSRKDLPGPAYIKKDIDYKKLKLFCLSYLWRVSISNMEEVKEISVGPFEDQLREMIDADDPGKIDDFSVLFSKFDSDDDLPIADKNIQIPGKIRIDGPINGFNLYLPKAYKFYVKVDKRSTSAMFRKWILDPSNKHVIILPLGDYKKSPEYIDLIRKVGMMKEENVNK